MILNNLLKFGIISSINLFYKTIIEGEKVDTILFRKSFKNSLF